MMLETPPTTRQPRSDQRNQFSLRQLMISIAAIAAILTLPGGAWLLGMLAGWVGIAIGVLVGLIVLQLPLFILVRWWIGDSQDDLS